MTALFVLPASVRTRLWPAPEEEPAARPWLLVGVAAVGVLGALTLRFDGFGTGSLLTGTAVLALALTARRRPPAVEDLLTASAAVALLSVASVRSAPWLVVLCLLGAWALGTLAVVGGRTWTGVLVGAGATALAPPRAARWASARLRTTRVPAAGRTAAVAGVSGALVLAFGGLFAAADPAYAHLLDVLLPALDLRPVVQRLVVLALVSGTAAVGAYLAQRPPAVDALAPPTAAPVRRTEWLVPLLLLDGLFLSFVAVQLSVLFGGRDHVLRTTGLSYAEYAREGFWQLLVVTCLTLLVIALAVRVAPRSSDGDRRLVRALLGVLCLLSLVVVGSALHRMALYESAYGFTRLRLLVQAVELALGALFVLLLVAGARWEGGWLPRAAVAVAALTLVGLAVLDPDRFIADRNVARYERTGVIDTGYLSTLSADAVPALMALPAQLRGCAVAPIAARLREAPDPWYDENLGRHRARALLASSAVAPCLTP